MINLVTLETILEIEGEQDEVDKFANDMADIIRLTYKRLLEERFKTLELKDDDVDIDIFEYEDIDGEKLEDIKSTDAVLFGRM